MENIRNLLPDPMQRMTAVNIGVNALISIPVSLLVDVNWRVAAGITFAAGQAIMLYKLRKISLTRESN